MSASDQLTTFNGRRLNGRLSVFRHSPYTKLPDGNAPHVRTYDGDGSPSKPVVHPNNVEMFGHLGVSD